VSDEHKLLRDKSRALGAQSLLDNDLFNEAHEALEAELIKAWKASNPRDTEGRERLWAAVQANAKHKDYIANILNDGKIAEAELKQISERPKRSFFG